MKVYSVSKVSFGGKIIDAHAHVGVFADDLMHTVDNFTAQDIVEISQKPINDGDTLEKVIVSNLDGIQQSGEGLQDVLARKGIELAYLSEYDANMKLHKMCQENPILKPLAICQPERNKDTSQIRRVLQEGKFYGLKFHPEHTKVGADNSIYEPYMKLAEEFDLPCLFHCDASGSQYSSPEQIYKLAKKFPKVKVILAHLGAGPDEVHQKAIDVMLESIRNGDALLYADISWVNSASSEKKVIVSALKQLQNTEKGDMTTRLLFGTDAPIGIFGAEGLKDENYYSNIVRDIKNSIKKEFGEQAETIINRLFYDNAEELFFSKKAASVAISTVEEGKKSASKSKIGKLILGISLLAGGLLGLFHYMKNSDKKNFINSPSTFRKIC